MTRRRWVLLAALLAASCHTITTAPRQEIVRPEASLGTAAESRGNRLVHVWESRDTLRFALSLSAELRAQDFEWCLTFDDGTLLRYGAGCYKGVFQTDDEGRDMFRWVVWRVYDGYAHERTGWVAETHNGPHVTFGMAWADLGGRRPLKYSFDLRDDRGFTVDRFDGAFDPVGRPNFGLRIEAGK